MPPEISEAIESTLRNVVTHNLAGIIIKEDSIATVYEVVGLLRQNAKEKKLEGVYPELRFEVLGLPVPSTIDLMDYITREREKDGNLIFVIPDYLGSKEIAMLDKEFGSKFYTLDTQKIKLKPRYPTYTSPPKPS